ncbi:MAG TPA: amidohydrolase [Bacteroidia bacterium]|nr:amidohydrolase [Bacteroidia bacterium]
MKQTFLSALLFASALYGCSTSNEKQKADLIICNAIVYTIDSAFATAESFAVKDGKILAVGKQEDIFSAYEGEKLDLQGKAVYPGLIDAHCHFLGYGKGLTQADLIDTKSFDEVIQRVVEYAKIKKGEWIIGRGWDQNDWTAKEFPTKAKLDSLFPSTPVFLKRVDGHAALVNSEALKRAGINEKTKLNGGLIEVKNNKPTGILVDNAVDLVANVIPPANKEEIQSALLAAQANCFAAGLTTVDDAGLEKQVVDIIDEMQKKGELKMRIYAMLTDNRENLNYYLEHGKYKSDRLNICSFKFYADGALGSRGACLLHPYSDKPKEQGFLLNKPEYFIEKSKQLFEKGFQMNTHCIGDSSDRFILDTYGAVLKEKNNKRWRIEHAQVVDKADIHKFHQYSIIPSVQSTHATSDMYWAKDRLGEERIRNAYVYKDLLEQAGTIALGTDFPVENINPLYTFYAAVARKDLKGFPEQGFQPENALTREEALKGMTIWAAYSNFEETEKGSIETGKWADFIITDKDIMKIDINEVPNVKILATYLNGEKVY